MKSSSGGKDLIDAGGIKYLAEELLKRVTVVTPNIAEAEILSGIAIKDHAGMEAAARKLVERGARAVVVKGGHMEKAVDVLFDGTEVLTLGGEHIKSDNTHGSGCTFASAIAAQLACGRPLREAVLLAKAYVTKAIEKGFSIGKGPGPLDHFYRIHQEPPQRGVHEVPQHGMHPAAEPVLVLAEQFPQGLRAMIVRLHDSLHRFHAVFEMRVHCFRGVVMHSPMPRQNPLELISEQIFHRVRLFAPVVPAVVASRKAMRVSRSGDHAR